MSKLAPLTVLALLTLPVSIVFILVWLVGVQILSAGDVTVSTRILGGFLLAVGLAANAASEYRSGAQRSALGIALWAVGIPLIVFDISSPLSWLGAGLILARLGVDAELDRRIRSQAM